MNKLLVANWKMNLSKGEGITLAKNISDFIENNDGARKVSISIAPSLPIVSEVSNLLLGTDIKLSAQDCSVKDNGAYTGEVSAKILRECGCKYVILGHSERRKYQGETSEIILKKAILAYKYGLTPIICIGETVEERANNATLEVLSQQLKFLSGLRDYSDKELIIAYEPVWAIGTGKSPTTGQIQEVVFHIKSIGQSQNLKILYGGSVTPENCQELLNIPSVGGLLIGGASLVYNKFIYIVRAALEMEKALA